MKTWPLLMGITVILAILCSPSLAISKSDLISQYKTGDFLTPVPTQTPGGMVVPVEPSPTLPIPSWHLPSPNWKFPIIPDSYGKNKSSYFQSLIETKQTMPLYDDDIPSKKPNIYLYSDRDLTAQVRLSPERAITVSDPVYRPGKGWLAEIRDGSLNGKGDFLFYESVVPASVWQKDEGYVIRAAHREQDMASMLGPYGFNEKETVEFIDYWSSHLIGDGDYAFYPQETGAVDQVMPLSVSPEPDHISRIWFYAEPLVSAPEPVTGPERIVREGFYVVEWGVMIQ